MTKKAEQEYPMHSIIQGRWSPLYFSSQDIPIEKLQSIFEAARWAASSMNEQPWRFIIANRESTGFSLMLSCLNEKNAEWAKNAPYLILTIVKTEFSRNNKPNRHAFYDTGQAVENLILQAAEMNIFAHQMGGFDLDKAKADFEIPDGYEPLVIIAMGYRGAAEKIPGDLSEKEKKIRSRLEYDKLIFGKKFGQKTNYFTR